MVRCVHATKPLSAEIADAEATLGPGDVFEVHVFQEKDLSGKYQVAPDGTIAFPFLGVIAVGGKDTRAIAEQIGARLEAGGFIRAPYVSVLLAESNSKRLSVLGAVAKPGTLPLTPGMTVVHAISQVGGFSPLASKDETVISRRVDGKLERYRVEVTRIVRGDIADFPLRSGDIIFVPERVF